MFEHLNNVQIQHNAVILSTDKSWKYLQMLLFVKMLKYSRNLYCGYKSESNFGTQTPT